MAPLPVAVSQSVPMRMPSKSAQTLSAEEQDLVDADQLFLDAILSGNVASVNTMLDGGQVVSVKPQTV